MPPKKKKRGPPKRRRPASPTPSEQEFLDSLPVAGDLISRTEQKTPSDVEPAYLIYVVCRTHPGMIPTVLIRKFYESKTDAAEAFKREYMTWVGPNEASLYPQCHTEEELGRTHLINLMDKRKAETEITFDPELPQGAEFNGRAKVEYEIVHRMDKDMDKQDVRQRKIVIICEETRFEAL